MHGCCNNEETTRSALETFSGTLMLVAALALPGTAIGAGYGIFEQGAAVLGTAGAGAAAVSDASALFYNPALLVRLEGTNHLDLGGSLLTPITSFAGVNPYPGYGVSEEMKRQMFPLPALYYARRLDERWAAGIGLNAPFGLGVEWKNPDQFSGRYVVTKADLRAVNLGVSGAYSINPILSVAAGGDVMFTKVDLENRTLAPDPGGGGGQVDVAKAKLESDIKPGYGWNAGVSVIPNDHWRLGAAYRGRVVAKPDGDATFTQIPTGDGAFDAEVAANLPPDQGVSTVLRFPAIWSVGAAWLAETWKVEADAVFTEWSVFRDLPIRLEQTPQNNRTLTENYDDTWAFRVGAERSLGAYRYRAGYYFEQEAAPSESVSPILPDAARHGITLGLGLSPGADKRWTIDLYDLALFLKRRSTEDINRDGFNGEYKTYINAVGFDVGYHW